jgi:Putative metal-binding motif
MIRQAQYRLAALVLVIAALISCTGILGVDTSYEPNPCSDAGLPAQSCGEGACKVLVEACQNGLPVECVPGAVDAEETCDGIDNNCDGIVDEGCECKEGDPAHPLEQVCFSGSPANRGVGACNEGKQKCTNSIWSPCDGDQLPEAEICDKIDNNCDGKVDEGCPCSEDQEQLCYGGPVITRNVGPCKDGKQKCQGGKWGECIGDIVPALEICNGADDNCNGVPDEGCPCIDGDEMDCYDGVPSETKGVGACRSGKSKCVKGVPGPCQGQVIPKTEVCDGVDNDCNGMTDDGNFGGVELCDGKDNNCNGQVDEGNPGGGLDCDTGKPGPCGAGLTNCANGSVVCKQKVSSIAESCDGVDNDCDGAIDNGNPGSGGPCTVAGLVGACAVGADACQGGQIVCKQTVTPTPESCNGKDDDCDGQTDEGDPGGGVDCTVPGKLGVCSAGKLHCVNGAPVCQQQVAQSLNELCDGLDNDCDGQTDESNPGGGGPCTVPGALGQCASGQLECMNGGLSCKQTVSAVPEVCNAKDDDCDGVVDNGNPQGGDVCPVVGQVGVCAIGSLQCLNGVLSCKQTGIAGPETCDGKDNNCNNQVDEGNPGGGLGCDTKKPGVCAPGLTSCTGGGVVCNQITASSPEICDGQDNDCNGTIDNGNPGGGLFCSTGNSGVCGPGTTACQNGAVVCTQNVAPSAEQCDGLDNNCNGQADEGDPGGGAACTTGLPGICSSGTRHCSNGALICTPNITASAEVCDGLDNNCDGLTDNGNPGGGAACNTGKSGICGQGLTVCSAGAIVCQQSQQPSTEICDGLDNDCNGVIDNGNPGSGTTCPVAGQQGPCAQGQTTCQNGSLACIQVNFATAEACDGIDNDCNGAVDNGNPGGGSNCMTGLPGICGAGVNKCQGGALICQSNLSATAEICDGLDNNCDGSIDNGNPGGGLSCSVPGKQGLCAAGSTVCMGGAVACQQVTNPVAETCDNKDNNCDGVIDDGNPGSGAPCTVPGKQGLCAQGLTTCSSGTIVCGQVINPTAETCDGLDNDCNGVIDDGSPGANLNCTVPGKQGACAAGKTICSAGAIVCNQTVVPSAEVCDNIDNNCNGQADEGNPGGGGSCNVIGNHGVCVAGTSACSNGTLICTQNLMPSAETCDGLDNNCDGTTDEGDPGGGAACTTTQQGVCSAGTRHCVSGSLACQQNVVSSAEVCDGLDNDCNGVTDNGNPGGGAPCSVIGQVGECAKGISNCVGGLITCTQVKFPMAQEVCDGLDNNCDGTIDEGDPGGNVSCITGKQGVCSAGTNHCVSGAVMCQQNVVSSAEICDGLDNNCNGASDEGDPGGGGVCTTGNMGVCSAGTKHCVAGALACQQNVMSSAEICDGLDNDCNGVADNGNPGGGGACVVPSKLGLCAAGTQTCVAGALTCPQAVFPAAEICDELDQNCNGFGHVFLAQNFSSDPFTTAPVWTTTGSGWEVKAAAASAMCGDPTDDTTPGSSDKKIVGVVVGSCAASGASGSLVSPLIPITAGSPVWLQFQRWLVTNAGMGNRVEVTDNVVAVGTWTVVYTSASGVVNDTSWSKQSFDLKPLISATATSIQIRWLYNFADGSQGGWNIDDVVVTNDGPCN